MKLAITLIAISSLLILEGVSRITMGILFGNIGLAFGGVLTGIILGGFLLYWGIKRYKRVKLHQAGVDALKWS